MRSADVIDVKRYYRPCLTGFIVTVLLSVAHPIGAQTLERDSPSCKIDAINAAKAGADRGAPAETYLLGRYYSTGKCLPGDGSEALRLYKRAAELKYPPAFYNLGIVAAGGDHDFQRAEQWWLQGAALGHRGCWLQLGIVYSAEGDLVNDNVKSFAWLSLAERPGGTNELHFLLSKVRARLTPTQLQEAVHLYDQLKVQYGSVPAFVP